MATVSVPFEFPLSNRPAILPEEQEKWFALVVKPRHEKAVERILSHKGFETFLPLQTRVHQYGVRKKEYRLPLFPGYVLCRFSLQSSLPVLTTPSVSRVAGPAGAPSPLDETEVESLRIAAASPYRLTPHAFLEPGCKVRIVEGPLTGAVGTVLEQKDSRRLVLSITMLQRSVSVVLEDSHVCAD